MIDFNTLAQQCALNVHPITMRAIVRTESDFNPYAIGVVGGRLARQPKNRTEAIATAIALDAQGLNFSLGLGQINKANFVRYGLTYESVFDPCVNLKAGSGILSECYERATSKFGTGPALSAAISCYYSGNFTRGFQVDRVGTSYVQRVFANATAVNPVIDVVPAIPVVITSPMAKKSNDAVKLFGTPVSASNMQESQRQTDKVQARWDAFGDFHSR